MPKSALFDNSLMEIPGFRGNVVTITTYEVIGVREYFEFMKEKVSACE